MDVVKAVSSTVEGFLHEHFDRSTIDPARQDSSALLEFYTTIHVTVITITPHLVRPDRLHTSPSIQTGDIER